MVDISLTMLFKSTRGSRCILHPRSRWKPHAAVWVEAPPVLCLALWNALIKMGTSKVGGMVILSMVEVPIGLLLMDIPRRAEAKDGQILIAQLVAVAVEETTPLEEVGERGPGRHRIQPTNLGTGARADEEVADAHAEGP